MDERNSDVWNDRRRDVCVTSIAPAYSTRLEGEGDSECPFPGQNYRFGCRALRVRYTDRPLPNAFPISPPIEPMLAKLAEELPRGDGFLYEPKWDGFRAIVFRGQSEVFIQSRDLRPLDRYFPELHAAFLAALPDDCIVDGEIVIATPHGLDFDALQLRLHPAASRVATLAKATPAAFVAFDVIAVGGKDVRASPQRERRVLLERLLAGVKPPIHLTPMTRDSAVASEWLSRFEGAGLDGVIVKPDHGTYEPGKRAMIKVKHTRTADCVVAGFRWHKAGHDRLVGSLLLGLYDDHGTLHHVGVASSFTMAMRERLARELAPLREGAIERHPWRDWAEAGSEMARMPGGQSRWSAGKDLSWEPLRIERVCEVKYDHMQGPRFRHAAVFLRWRPDKPPADCRYDQLETTTPYELEKVFGAAP
jgi:ATP-dependent DNA ligase